MRDFVGSGVQMLFMGKPRYLERLQVVIPATNQCSSMPGASV